MKRPKRYQVANQLAKQAGLLAICATMLYPVIWMVFSSFKPERLIFSEPGLLSRAYTTGNYARGWWALPLTFGEYILNSLFVAIVTIGGNLVACSLTAYAFARLRFPFRRLWMAIMLATIMLPVHVTLVPQYLLFSRLGWLNTYLPLTVPHFLATDAFFIFLMVQFMRGIPRDLDDAAKIDGCGVWRIYLHVMLPNLKPALVTTVIFTFINSWNEFLHPLVYLTNTSMFTVPLALRLFLDKTTSTSWGPLFAMSILSLIPVFIVFLFGQRHLIRGIATTGFN